MLDELHAAHGIEPAGHLGGKLAAAHEAVVDLRAGLGRMQPRDLDHAGRQVDRRDARAGGCQRLGQQPAAATDVGHARTSQREPCIHPGEPDRIERMQRVEGPGRIPELLRLGIESGQFGSVGIGGGVHWKWPFVGR